jgi:hypothetical protein
MKDRESRLFMSRLSQNFASIDQSSSAILSSGAAPNGRVDILSSMPVFKLPSQQLSSVKNNDYAREALNGDLTRNPVSELFFSELNINVLQDGIRYRIYNETNGKYTIGRQSDQELKAVMRSIYYQYSLNQDTNCVGQVKVLNSYVLNWCVSEILSNLLQYQQYKIDSSTLPMPLDRSPIMTTKGTKTLEITSFM